MKLLFITLICLFITSIYAQEVKINVNPLEPVINESFNVEFRISLNDDAEPNINFNPSGIEVMGKSDQIMSTKTTYINGRLSMSRELVIVYEMMATRSGVVYLNDIEVELNGNIIKQQNLRINILSKPKEREDVLLIAEVPKKTIYKGESLLVRYYLLDKINVSTFDIKSFPKLNNFLKRFHDEKLATDRVNYEGEIYVRRVLYTAQLFPEKLGKLKIDPLRIEVNYPVRRNDPFGGLGLGLSYQGMKSKSLSSKPVEVEVIELPKDNMPSSFSGLVGNHDVKFEINRNKFIVNEPIELKLIINGEGALETFEAPKLLNSTNLEEFETNNDLSIQKDFTAIKQFDYTYLARNSDKIPQQSIPFTYFDVNSSKYITKNINIPEIIIQGGAAQVQGQNSDDKTQITSESSITPAKNIVIERGLLIPTNVHTSAFLNIRILNYLLLLILTSLIIFKFYIYYKSKGFHFSLFNNFEFESGEIIAILKSLNSSSTKSIENIIKESNLTKDGKKYFLDVLGFIHNQYSPNGKKGKIKLNKKFYKELIRSINENNN